jgi:hypothetical protein
MIIPQPTDNRSIDITLAERDFAESGYVVPLLKAPDVWELVKTNLSISGYCNLSVAIADDR